jgi:uncharacterized protein
MVKPVDDKALFFAGRLREQIGSRLLQLVLFGSRARGDAHEGSDYDFLVVLDTKDEAIRERILITESEFMNKFEELSACLIFDEPDWERNKKFPIGINILRDGVPL